MYVGPRLRKVLSRLNRASSIEALRDGLADAALLMGFPYVALVQHGGLPRLVEGALVVTNYPEDFVRSYIDNHYFVIDPVYEVSQQLDRPFGWEEIAGFVELADHQLALFQEARRYGIAYGVTVPLAIPSDSRASCSFAGPEPIEITPPLMATLQIVAGFARCFAPPISTACYVRSCLCCCPCSSPRASAPTTMPASLPPTRPPPRIICAVMAIARPCLENCDRGPGKLQGFAEDPISGRSDQRTIDPASPKAGLRMVCAIVLMLVPKSFAN